MGSVIKLGADIHGSYNNASYNFIMTHAETVDINGYPHPQHYTLYYSISDVYVAALPASPFNNITTFKFSSGDAVAGWYNDAANVSGNVQIGDLIGSFTYDPTGAVPNLQFNWDTETEHTYASVAENNIRFKTVDGVRPVDQVLPIKNVYSAFIERIETCDWDGSQSGNATELTVFFNVPVYIVTSSITSSDVEVKINDNESTIAISSTVTDDGTTLTTEIGRASCRERV